MIILTFLTQISYAHNVMFHWDNSFDVEICQGVNITTEEVKSALNFWSNKINFKANTITFKIECKKPGKNVIQIKKDVNLPENFYGETDVNWFFYNYAPDTKYINYATIRLGNNFIKENNITLTHEIGHALGLGHEDDGIMRSKY